MIILKHNAIASSVCLLLIGLLKGDIGTVSHLLIALQDVRWVIATSHRIVLHIVEAHTLILLLMILCALKYYGLQIGYSVFCLTVDSHRLADDARLLCGVTLWDGEVDIERHSIAGVHTRHGLHRRVGVAILTIDNGLIKNLVATLKRHRELVLSRLYLYSLCTVLLVEDYNALTAHEELLNLTIRLREFECYAERT